VPGKSEERQQLRQAIVPGWAPWYSGGSPRQAESARCYNGDSSLVRLRCYRSALRRSVWFAQGESGHT
jgi:hypothetical protein